MAFYLFVHRDLSEKETYHKIELYVSDVHNLFLYSVEIEWGLEKISKEIYYDPDKPNKELAEEIKQFLDNQINEFYGDLASYGDIEEKIKAAIKYIHRLLDLKSNE